MAQRTGACRPHASHSATEVGAPCSAMRKQCVDGRREPLLQHTSHLRMDIEAHERARCLHMWNLLRLFQNLLRDHPICTHTRPASSSSG